MDKKGVLRLSDGTELEGYFFGHSGVVSGELLLDTTMIGYTEVITDPIYNGKLLTLTYPIIGNYGFPSSEFWESDSIQPAGIIVHDYTEEYNHWNAIESLGEAMDREQVVGIYGIDTHILAKKIASNPGLTGQILPIPNTQKAIEVIKVKKNHEPNYLDQNSDKTLLLIDLGANSSFIQSFIDTGVNILRVSGTEDYSSLDYDGIIISNGPGEIEDYSEVVNLIKFALSNSIPVYGCGLGYDLMAKAIDVESHPYFPAHRSLGQPVQQVGTNSCFITRMSHHRSIYSKSLPNDWRPYFTHLNSKINVGFIHNSGKFVATAFQPDSGETKYIIDHFITSL